MAKRSMRCLVIMLALSTWASAQTPNPYVKITGVLQGPNGLPAANDIISLTPTQSFFVPGTGEPGEPNYFVVANYFLTSTTDIAQAANAACLSGPVGGTTVYIAAGIYYFSHTLSNQGRNCFFIGAGAGTPSFPASPAQLVGTDLIYTGSGIAINITGNAVQSWIENLALDNIGTGTVGVNFDIYLNHSGMINVSINPQGTGSGEVCFSTAAIQAGATANVVDTMIQNSYIRCDQPTSVPPGLLALGVNAVLTVDHTHFIGGGVVLGSAGQSVTGFHCTSCFFDMEGGGGSGPNNQDAIQVVNAYNWSCDDCGFEIGQATTNQTTGYAVNVLSTATRSISGAVTNSYINGVYAADTTYAFNLNNANSTFVARGNYFSAFAGTAYVLRDQNTAMAVLSDNVTNSVGMTMTSSGSGGPVCLYNNYSVALAAFYNDFSCTPVFTVSGNLNLSTSSLFGNGTIVESGLAGLTPRAGDQIFCSDCQVTTAASCSTATPASCVCKASGNGAVAKYENYQGNGLNWYCQ
jgi:hypothetical protein